MTKMEKTLKMLEFLYPFMVTSSLFLDGGSETFNGSAKSQEFLVLVIRVSSCFVGFRVEWFRQITSQEWCDDLKTCFNSTIIYALERENRKTTQLQSRTNAFF